MSTKHSSAVLIALLAFGSFLGVATVMSDNASAAGVSGTWVSRVSGEGFVTEGYYSAGPYTWHYDVKMSLSTSGSFVYGSETITVRTVDDNPGYPGWPQYPYPMGESFTYQVDGQFDDTTLELTVYATGAILGFTLTVSGDTMYGNGLYDSAGVTMIGTYDLKKEGGFGSLSFGGSTTTFVASGAAIAVAIAAIAVASTPMRISTTQAPQPSPWQPLPEGETRATASPISSSGAVPQGGIGLHYPAPPPTGKPLAPREHYLKTSQDPPRCPVHRDTALSPHYRSADDSDPGSWFCPKCNSYPWGRS